MEKHGEDDNSEYGLFAEGGCPLAACMSARLGKETGAWQLKMLEEMTGHELLELVTHDR